MSPIRTLHLHLGFPSRGALIGSALLLSASAVTAQGFVERSAEVGLAHEFMTGLDRIGTLAPMADWSQQGVALGDLDGDGDLDVVAASRFKPNHVFRQNAEGQFIDVSAVAQIDAKSFDNCVALGDYDRDGDLDIFIGSVESGGGPKPGRSRLYANVGLAPFQDVTAAAGTTGNGHSICAAWVDLDRDGLLDLHVSEFHGTFDAHYRNHGDGSFTDVAADLGLSTGGSTHVTAFFDADGDGYYDVFPGTDWRVSNNANLHNNSDDRHLWGRPDGTFVDVTAGSEISKDGEPNFGSATMGIAVGDVDYDGDFDMYETQVEVQFLAINNGWPGGSPWSYAEDDYGVTNELTNSPSGMGETVGWGCAFFDADFDPWLDLFKVNGHVSGTNPTGQQNYFFRGLGPAGSFAFEDKTAEFGLQSFYDARGIAVGDVDGDGDVDILSAAVVDTLRYYENQVDPQGQAMVAVRPVCRTSAGNGFGVVASWLDSLGYVHKRQIGSDGTTAGQNEYVARFGIGFETDVDLEVEFPSGMVLSFPDTPPNTEVLAIEPEMIEIPARVLTLPTGGLGPAGIKKGKSTAIGKYGRRFFKIAANAYDASGNELDGGAAVTIEMPGIQPLGPVKHVSGNHFERLFQMPTSPGRYAVHVSFDDWQVKVRPVITFRGALDPAASRMVLKPVAVRAGSADTFDVIVSPRTAQGTLVGGKNVVEVQSAGAIPLTELTSVGDGSYRGTFSAPAVAGSYGIEAFVNGKSLGTLGTVEVGGTAFGPSSLYYPEFPNPDFAMLPHQLKVLVTPRDLFGQRLGPETDVDVSIDLNVASDPVTVLTNLIDNASDNGSFFFVLEKPVGGSASGTMTFSADGTTLFTKPFSY